MGRKKLPPEEALKRLRESRKKYKQKLAVKLRRRELAAIQRRALRSTDVTDEMLDKQKRLSESKNASKRKSRLDPVKYARELHLQRERRKRKREEHARPMTTKRLRLDSGPSDDEDTSHVVDARFRDAFDSNLDIRERSKHATRDSETGREKKTSLLDRPYSNRHFKRLLKTCNSEQRDVLRHVRHQLQSEPDKRLYCLVHGSAGTGKSFLIDVLVETCARLFAKRDRRSNRPTVLKLAPTGKAASNIRGQTIHYALGIKSLNSHESVDNLLEYVRKYADLKMIVIDEISMVGSKLYEKMNQQLKLIKGNDLFFGGLHVVHFGDFRQLPPVKDVPIYTYVPGLNTSSYQAWQSVRFFELTQIMRQKDDIAYAELLNRIATAKVTDEDETFLKSKQTTIENVSKSATLLYHSNRDVDLANEIRLNGMEGDVVKCRASDFVLGNASWEMKKRALLVVKNMDRTKTANLEYDIKFKVGARYMITRNIDVSDGLVNGAVGVLKKIEYRYVEKTKRKKVKRVWLDFIHQEKIGREKRKKFIRYATQNGIDLNWTPIERINKVIYSKANDTILVSRYQFPLIIAEAMTIHKSQGATFPEVAIGFTSYLTRTLQYVAFSRVTSANGLYIIGKYKKPPPPKEDDPIIQEIKRLKSNSIIPKFPFLREHNDPNTLQIMYQNVQSLNSNYDNIAADPVNTKSDILLLVETWTVMKDQFRLDGFDHYHLLSDLQKRKPSGVSVYINQRLKFMVEDVHYFPNYETGVHIMVVIFKTKVRIAVLYANPGSLDDDIFDAINQSFEGKHMDYKTVLAGDFNINMNTERGIEICDYMDSFYCLQLRNNPTASTTIHYTTIDCIFSTNSLKVCGVYENSYSTHLPLYIQMPWEKMKVPTTVPSDDDDPRLECGPDLLDRTREIPWIEEDDDYLL